MKINVDDGQCFIACEMSQDAISRAGRRRRRLLVAATAWPFAAIAQPARKQYRIGYLSNGPGIERRDDAFRERLAKLGFVDGKNAVIEWRFNKGKLERNPELARELVRLKVDCIVAVGVTPIRAAKEASSTVPIVMATIDADPVELGFVASLAKPGGNVTGFTGIAYDLAGKRLELLKEVVPKANRVGVLVGAPLGTGSAAYAHVRGTEIAARKLGMQVKPFAPSGPDDLERMLTAARDDRPEVLSVVTIGWINSHRERVVDLAAKLRVPAIYSSEQFTSVGGLMSYATDSTHQFSEAATCVAKILAGAKPSELPVQQPTKFELEINLKTAKALGISFPQTILVRADRVLE